MNINSDETDKIFWAPPRPLLLEVIPTLARRLWRNWEYAHTNESDLNVPFKPLPDFLPAALFSDLNLPEVQIIIPAARRGDEDKKETMPIASSLRQLAPGRVTRRFADERGELAHWVAIKTNEPTLNLSISDYSSSNEYIGKFKSTSFFPGQKIPVYRPWVIKLSEVPKEVSPSSRADFKWESDFEAIGSPTILELPKNSGWTDLLTSISFYLHRQSSNVSVRRFASRATANIRRLKADDIVIDVNLTDDNGNPAAVGFEVDADGIAIDIKLPSASELNERELPSHLTSSTRTSFYRDLVKENDKLPVDINTFQRDWLQQIYFSAVILRAERKQISMLDAVEELTEEGASDSCQEVMEGIFSIQEARAFDDDGEKLVHDGELRNRTDKLKDTLRDLFNNQNILTCLADALKTALSDKSLKWGSWLKKIISETLAQAMIEALGQAAPEQVAPDTLVVDIVEKDDALRLWVTETTLGGAGVVENIAEMFVSQPRRFFQALESALAPGDLELAEIGLTRTVKLSVSDPDVANRINKIRSLYGHEEREIARGQFISILASRGVMVGHSLAVALSARLLRPGTSLESDELVFDLLNRWEELENRLGIVIGLREYSYIAVNFQFDVEDRLRKIGIITPDHTKQDLVQILAGFLWPRGHEIRGRSLQTYNPYRTAHTTDPALLRALFFETIIPEISVEDPNWLDILKESLAEKGATRIKCPIGQEESLKNAILLINSTPIEVGPLHLYAALERLDHDGKMYILTVTLREVSGW